MTQPLASLICDANAVLIANGNLEAIEKFFSPEYVVNVTGQRIAGGHDIVRKILGSILKSTPVFQIYEKMFFVNDRNGETENTSQKERIWIILVGLLRPTL